MELRLNANAVVTNEKGEFLLIRLKGGPFAGGLCIPGGGVEPGELSHEAARREVFEETGIDISSKFVPFGFCELKHNTIQKHKVVMLLHANSNEEPQETEEGVAGWFSYDVAEKDLIPFAKEAIRIWKSNDMHFSLIDEATDGGFMNTATYTKSAELPKA